MQRILITRPRVQADDFAEKLRVAGFEPIFFPVIEIKTIENNSALEKAIEHIHKYDWVVFTSVNAVSSTVSPNFLQKWGECPEGTRGVRVAAIGPKTAEALRKHNIEPDFVPDEYVGEAIMSGLGDVKGKWILLPRAEIARQELPEAISKAGGIAHEIVVYKTLPAEVDMNGLDALKSGMDIITFTSASTVENFVVLTRQYGLNPFGLSKNPVFACIGPVTEQAAREAGFQNIITAKEYTTDGLLEAIAKMEIL